MDQSKHAIIVDLNRYRVRDLKPYLDAGVDGFIFRIGGPSRWYDGDYGYKEDETWRPYIEQADKYGIPRDRIGGYIVHNPFEIWTTDYNVHIDLLNQWTGGGYMPGYFILDHEVNYVWRGGTKVIVTPHNLVGSMASVMDKMYKKFRRPVMLYTARWFIDQNGPTEHMVKLDNINGAEKQWGMWYAAYLHQNIFGTKIYSNARDAIADVPTPTGDQVARYFQCGSHSLYDIMQVTDRFKVTGDTVGVDMSITRLPADEYFAQMGARVGPVTPPPPPPADPDPETGPDYATREEYLALLDRVTALEAFRAKVKEA